MTRSNSKSVDGGAGNSVILFSLAFLILAGAGFYFLPKQYFLLFSLFLVLCVVLLLATLGYGKKFFNFSLESYRELKKVVWPSRKETGQTTLIVFLFVTLVAIFLWGVDKLLEWSVFTLVLGWK
ncbi:MAG: preprotein translocase subunit SecE [Ottowia sp.]|nr:preprotein translocase subunit SecE [Ottowia sp.]